MKDERGVYYFPFPDKRQVRMYVRNVGGEVCFRMWNADDPGLWEQHGWVAYEAVRQAADMYRRGSFDPRQAYDLTVAKALLKSEES